MRFLLCWSPSYSSSSMAHTRIVGYSYSMQFSVQAVINQMCTSKSTISCSGLFLSYKSLIISSFCFSSFLQFVSPYQLLCHRYCYSPLLLQRSENVRYQLKRINMQYFLLALFASISVFLPGSHEFSIHVLRVIFGAGKGLSGSGMGSVQF